MLNRIQSGFSLVELVVAMGVMAVGLVGTVAMQATAKQNGVDSAQRTLATNLAQNMINRIRLNRENIASYVASDYGVATYSTNLPCLYSANDQQVCTSQQLAAFDSAEWNAMLNGESLAGNNSRVSGLVNPVACVSYTQASGEVTVVISWTGRKITADAGTAAVDNQALAGLKDACGKNEFSSKLERRRQVVLQTVIG